MMEKSNVVRVSELNFNLIQLIQKNKRSTFTMKQHISGRFLDSYLHLGFFSKHLSIKLWKWEENLRDFAMATISIPPFSSSALCWAKSVKKKEENLKLKKKIKKFRINIYCCKWYPYIFYKVLTSGNRNILS